MTDIADVDGANKTLQPLSKDQLIRAFDAAYEQLLVAATTAVERGCVGREGTWGRVKC